VDYTLGQISYVFKDLISVQVTIKGHKATQYTYFIFFFHFFPIKQTKNPFDLKKNRKYFYF